MFLFYLYYYSYGGKQKIESNIQDMCTYVLYNKGMIYDDIR